MIRIWLAKKWLEDEDCQRAVIARLDRIISDGNDPPRKLSDGTYELGRLHDWTVEFHNHGYMEIRYQRLSDEHLVRQWLEHVFCEPQSRRAVLDRALSRTGFDIDLMASCSMDC